MHGAFHLYQSALDTNRSVMRHQLSGKKLCQKLDRLGHLLTKVKYPQAEKISDSKSQKANSSRISQD